MDGFYKRDQNISYYSVILWSKKWRILFFMFITDAAVQNAWLLYRSSSSHDNEPTDLLSFQKEIANVYRMKYSSRQRSHIFSPADVTLLRGKSNEIRVPSEVRFDGIKHYPLSNPTQRRCSYCHKKSKYVCSKCDIGLHIACFESLTKFRGGSKTAAASKMERFVIIVNGFRPLTIITKRSILDVSAALDPPLKLIYYTILLHIPEKFEHDLNMIWTWEVWTWFFFYVILRNTCYIFHSFILCKYSYPRCGQ